MGRHCVLTDLCALSHFEPHTQLGLYHSASPHTVSDESRGCDVTLSSEKDTLMVSLMRSEFSSAMSDRSWIISLAITERICTLMTTSKVSIAHADCRS